MDNIDDLSDLFWPKKEMVRTGLPPASWAKIAGYPEQPRRTCPGCDICEGDGGDWDELSHIKEQYDIKCDELLAAMLENRRLSLIILKHGLDSELEINDETCENDQEDS